jgi:hypothetical protein
MGSNSSPNPVLLVTTHLPEHVRDLETRLDRAVAKVREIQQELAVARTLLAVVPAAEMNGKDILRNEG